MYIYICVYIYVILYIWYYIFFDIMSISWYNHVISSPSDPFSHEYGSKLGASLDISNNRLSSLWFPRSFMAPIFNTFPPSFLDPVVPRKDTTLSSGCFGLGVTLEPLALPHRGAPVARMVTCHLTPNATAQLSNSALQKWRNMIEIELASCLSLLVIGTGIAIAIVIVA